MFTQTKLHIHHISKVLVLSLKFPPKIIKKILLHNHPFNSNFKINYYKWYCRYIYKKLYPLFQKSFKIINTKSESVGSNSGIIWIFWWQGYNNMPQIVKACYKSVLKHSNKHRVILIDEQNIKKYTNISNIIYYKLYKHEITLTHFSDILRFNLLKNYGGLWIDSTVFCSSNFDDNYFNKIYTSGGYSIPQSRKVFANKWTEFLIGGNKNNKMFQFMDIFFKIYWHRNKYLIDYFLVDYALYYIYLKNISGFKNYVDNIASKNNPHLYDLIDYLNNEYNFNKFKEITNNTNLFKLTYQIKFNSDGDTFYNRLIHGNL